MPTWQEIAERRMAQQQREREEAQRKNPDRFVHAFREEKDEEAQPKGRLFGGSDRKDYD